jgi:cytochrome c biogenesis protein CcmG, thiol:disulfide interchange protein DsbE
VEFCKSHLLIVLAQAKFVSIYPQGVLLVKATKQSAFILSLCFSLAILLSACNSPISSNPDDTQRLSANLTSNSEPAVTENTQPEALPLQPSSTDLTPVVTVAAVTSVVTPQVSPETQQLTPVQPSEQPAQLATPTPQALAGLGSAAQPLTKAANTSQKPEVGFAAPDFTLTGLDGNTISLSDLRGKAVVINYWESWCIPCQDDLPILDKLGQEYEANGVTVLSIDGIQQDTLGDVQSTVSKLGLTHPILLDDGNSFSKAYWVKFMPTSIFIDREGVIRYIQLGSTSEENFRAKIEELLSNSS